MHLQESSVNRFLEGKAGLLERWGVNENDMSLYTTEELLDVARRDNALIRGWGATCVLREIMIRHSKDEAERLARAVPGITSVRNELIVLRSVLGP